MLKIQSNLNRSTMNLSKCTCVLCGLGLATKYVSKVQSSSEVVLRSYEVTCATSDVWLVLSATVTKTCL